MCAPSRASQQCLQTHNQKNQSCIYAHAHHTTHTHTTHSQHMTWHVHMHTTSHMYTQHTFTSHGMTHSHAHITYVHTSHNMTWCIHMLHTTHKWHTYMYIFTYAQHDMLSWHTPPHTTFTLHPTLHHSHTITHTAQFTHTLILENTHHSKTLYAVLALSLEIVVLTCFCKALRWPCAVGGAVSLQ